MTSRPAVLLVCGWALLLAAWAVGNPPFAAPDEVDHYVRAVGLSSGDLVGRPAGAVAIGATPAQVAWTRQAARRVTMPPGLGAPTDCYVHDASRSAGCLRGAAGRGAAARVVQVTPVGTYQPLPYLLPAAAVRLGDGAQAAVRWGRVASGLLCLALLAAAVWVLRGADGDPRRLLGPVVAVTPMVLFCGASLTGSGPEIAAGVAFAAGVLALARGPGGGSAPAAQSTGASAGPATPAGAAAVAAGRAAGRGAWAVAGASGLILALSRSASPLWVVLALLLGIAVAGPAAAWGIARRGGAAALAAGGAVLAGIVLNRAWEAAYGPLLPLSTHALRAGVRAGVDQWLAASQQVVGQFGYLEARLPLWIPLLWLPLVLALGAFAWAACGRRRRAVLAVAGAVALGLPVALYALVIRPTGFGLQGRHVLPILVAIPLLAGELAAGGRRRIPAWLVAAIPAAAGIAQLAAWWMNARRAAVGVHGPLLFLGRGDWSPPLGWGLWLVVAFAGATAVGAVGVAGRRVARRGV